MTLLVYRDWKDESKSIEVARRLVAEAGYPNGVDAKTGKPLVLYLDWVRRVLMIKPDFCGIASNLKSWVFN
ncbi:hypothetical protein [Candidatus Marithrix sp. Canyon 246]|uniref:hypothetical protein n=1 Tax=Candidatus Marithrix sp. Canyon 246 TaxID=1827136 RepID=UPI00084A240F|nr:hypothetical protein [Candidatus Marithrix sp. Canyon 246]